MFNFLFNKSTSQQPKPVDSYRVLKIRGKFIPQVRTTYEWEGLDRDLHVWSLPEHQIAHCSHDTEEDARETIAAYEQFYTEKGCY